MLEVLKDLPVSCCSGPDSTHCTPPFVMRQESWTLVSMTASMDENFHDRMRNVSFTVVGSAAGSEIG